MVQQVTYNPFEGVNNAPTSTQGAYLVPGRYKLRIGKCLFKKLFKGGEAYIAEMTVLESSSPDIPVGGQRTWLQKNNESFKASVKLFAIAALGFDAKDEKQVKEVSAHTETALNKSITDNLFSGREVYCDVTAKEKKQSEGQFNLHTFSPAMPPLK